MYKNNNLWFYIPSCQALHQMPNKLFQHVFLLCVGNDLNFIQPEDNMYIMFFFSRHTLIMYIDALHVQIPLRQ